MTSISDIKPYPPEEIAASNAPDGFAPIESHSHFGCRNGPLFERSDSDGVWQRGIRIMEKHVNAGGFCHGGMLMTMADIVLARGVITVAPHPFVTMRMTTDFIGTAMLGEWVAGSARVSRKTGSMVFVEGELTAVKGEKRRVILTASGIFKLLRSKK